MNKWGFDQFFIAKYAIIKRLKFAALCWRSASVHGRADRDAVPIFSTQIALISLIYADYFFVDL